MKLKNKNQKKDSKKIRENMNRPIKLWLKNMSKS